MRWYWRVVRQYAVFKGRAGRREFWYFLLFQVLVVLLVSFLERQFAIADPEICMGRFTGFYLLATFLPALAVTARRLHDCGLSSWWILVGFIPLTGAVILLVLAALPGATGNRCGHKIMER